MLQVQIVAGGTQTREGISKKTGKAYKIIKQAALVKFPSGIVSAVELQPPYGQEAYAPGQYTLDPGSFFPKDGTIGFSVKLAPVVGGTK